MFSFYALLLYYPPSGVAAPLVITIFTNKNVRCFMSSIFNCKVKVNLKVIQYKTALLARVVTHIVEET